MIMYMVIGLTGAYIFIRCDFRSSGEKRITQTKQVYKGVWFSLSVFLYMIGTVLVYTRTNKQLN